jgi:hypothetical protein
MRPDAATALAAALRLDAGRANADGATVEVVEATGRPWASVTFSGERHRLTLSIKGPSSRPVADAFLNGLAEREIELRGHILAGITCLADERVHNDVRLHLEALTVEAA